MKPTKLLSAIVLSVATMAPATASAAITEVFTQPGATPITCNTQASGAAAGLRYCQGAYTSQPSPAPPTVPTTIPSWDGTPIDVAVVLPPAPASGPDGNFPTVGIYHGYGGSKLFGAANPTSANSVHRWVTQGYAVFSITDRGFWGSCGVLVPGPKPPACDEGHIHLMSNAYEVRDAQYLMGQLADEGVIDPKRIGATGGSYGGGMSMQLGALRNRIQLPDGTYQPWTSPDGKAMEIAATAPEYGWSDLRQSLMPNGSALDYAASNPYLGPGGDRRFGVQKAYWNAALYQGGAQTGYYAAPGDDPSSDITSWKAFNDTGGPYDGEPLAIAQNEAFKMIGAMEVDDSVAPAPSVISNGWNDDLFPVSEAVQYYNKVRAKHPSAPISMFHVSWGHPSRGDGSAGQLAADATQVFIAEHIWFAHYVKQDGSAVAPLSANGGVTIATSKCAGTVTAPGTVYQAKNWASLAAGEVRVSSEAGQTVMPNSFPAYGYSATSDTVCTTQPTNETPGAAIYKTDPAPAGGFTIAGSPTILADLAVQGANDAVVGRLYDVDPDAGTEKLIARGIYRPTGVGATTRQVFQLHPQAYAIAAGHVVRLELLGFDAPYARPSTGQNPVGVSNLELRLPTVDAPGAAAGLVKSAADKVLPSGYSLAKDLLKPAVSEEQPPPPVQVPPGTTPTGSDPVALATIRAAMRKKPAKIKLAKNRKTLAFTEALPSAGRVSYRLRLRWSTGKGKRARSHVRTLGSTTVTPTAAGKRRITIKINAKGRSALKAHPRDRLVLDATFTTPVEGKSVTTTRKFKR